jgi:hypothetical protein
MKLAALAILAATIAGAAQAQSSYVQQRNGAYTYYNGMANGQPLTGTSQQLGNYNYSTFSNGHTTTNCTSNRVGAYVYSNCY